MSTSGPTQLPAYFSSSTDFQGWVTGVHTALAAIGLVQTADTGQINPATVALPGVANTAAGYEIWRLNDALQSTAPYFFKIEYGVPGQLDRPALWLTVGSGSNGSGTLTGNLSTRTIVAPGNSKSPGNTLPTYASGDGSRFALCTNADPGTITYALWIACERTRDVNGNYTADGLVICLGGSAGSTQCAFATYPNGGTVASNRTSALPLIPACGSGTGSQHAVGGNSALGTMAYFCGGPFFGLSLADVVKTDVAAVGTAFTATVLGASHTYMPLLPPQFGVNYSGGTDNNNDYLCLLWE